MAEGKQSPDAFRERCGNDLVISLDDITSKMVLTGYSLKMYTITR
jgi:hypothetical protein